MQRKRKCLVSLLAAAALLGGAGVAGCGNDTERKAARISLEAAGVIAPKPFMEAPDSDLRGVKAVTGARSRGAFGGTPGRTRCDKATLIQQITADKVKADAWAKARGIPADKIAEHIRSLTEEIVPEDTLVKNHNYEGDGKTVAYLSVLQVGTAVLLDPYDNPAVKCNCGNPLRQPENGIDREASTYTGKRWESFQSTQVTVIIVRSPEEGPRETLPVIDVQHPDRGFNRPAGSDGSTDSKPYPVTPPPSTVPTPSGSAPGTGSPSGPGEPSGSGSPSTSGTPSGSGGPSVPGPSSGRPSTGGPVTSKPPSGKPPATSAGPPRTGSPASSRPPATGKPPVASHSAAAAQPTAARTTAAAPPVHTTAAAPPAHTTGAAPPARTTAAAPPLRTTAAPVPSRTVAPPDAVTPGGQAPPGPARSAVP